MKFIILFIIFCVFYSIFDWIIKKTDIHNKLFNKAGMKKHIKIILTIIIVVFAFFIEYEKQVLKDVYGDYSYICFIIGAFLSSIYMNFVPLIFGKNK
ncbi:magnesium-transporting ATPase (P-type) [Clostridium saccharoperbutylacetonicum]|uniref:Uncharacterized protein n=1 Tax=Clostridium saccharoperbutylacetonicum N1-4(HMT) TaxID=931276 RepID=M1MDT5_9CLOT|nr:hypothetical protein [Clostridium saccharoperbutylacetonicum]AGF56079.1 hypothetical protein Cspa_c23140 [Clostridium saccharoperbutylacetonicum N1-4(HMT)]NRT63181.1 magnesium-transporting ATPase (P-type) [Clostridium saccharoperbutylacetonicum]NSB26541.1 magnesium-transporting ATPase (P-type) [Clostridium saccharoperbutylacetonicum]NSB45891.1 magnesium-transporting ATPase (P-type) [Clostridium saccharoperbutylacetonicum]